MLGERLKELRKSKHLTQGQLGKKLGLSASAVGMYEHDRRFPDNATIMKITDFFEVSSDYLLGRNTQDVKTAIDGFKSMLKSNGALMFNGVPLSPDDAEKILDAMELGARMVLKNK